MTADELRRIQSEITDWFVHCEHRDSWKDATAVPLTGQRYPAEVRRLVKIAADLAAEVERLSHVADECACKYDRVGTRYALCDFIKREADLAEPRLCEFCVAEKSDTRLLSDCRWVSHIAKRKRAPKDDAPGIVIPYEGD